MAVEYGPILTEVQAALDHQIAKWGEQRHTCDQWVVIQTEELGEVARAAFELWKADSDFEAEAALDSFEHEMVQMAAVAIASVESIRAQREGYQP